MQYDVIDFESEVIEASYEMPVLVDFWAPWCGPCRMLGPILERLATEQRDRWKLAKLNTDEQPELSMQFGIRGIPAVKLFSKGQVVSEFVGAKPEHEIRQWLDASIPSEERQDLLTAQQLLQAGDVARAEEVLDVLLQHHPDHGEARLLLAQIVAGRDIDEAARLVEGVEPSDAAALQFVEGIVLLANMRRQAGEPASMPEGIARPEYLQAVEALASGDLDAALSRFIAVIMKDRYYLDDVSRKACVALFGVLGPHHPLTRKHRRMFEMALY
ncbi:MAG: thioredoxin [Rhodothermales bacterium]